MSTAAATPSNPSVTSSSTSLSVDDWICQATIIPNLGTLWQSTWAHPEFGQIIALCGEHTIVTIWEEQETVDNQGTIVSRWNKRAELGDARNSVYDIQFAPRHSGLRLATASGDGYVRIYEVTDVMNLTHWPLVDELYDDTVPWTTTMTTTNSSSSSTGGSTGTETPLNENNTSALAYRTNSKAVTCLSWCTSQFDTPMLVIGNSYGKLRIWGYASTTVRKWVPMLDLSTVNLSPSTTLSSIPYNRILDVAWAPNIGRSYHYISASTVDGYVYLWKILPDNPTDKEWNRVAVPTILTTDSNHGVTVTNPSSLPLGTVAAQESTESSTKIPFSSWKTSFYNSLSNYNYPYHSSMTGVAFPSPYLGAQSNIKYPSNIQRYPYSTVNAVLTERFASLQSPSSTLPLSSSSSTTTNSSTFVSGGSTIPAHGNVGVTNKSVWRTVWNVSGTVLVTVEDNGIILFRRQQFPNGAWQIIGCINEQGEELLYANGNNSDNGTNYDTTTTLKLKARGVETSRVGGGNHNHHHHHQYPQRTPPSSAVSISINSNSEGSNMLNKINSPILLPASAIH